MAGSRKKLGPTLRKKAPGNHRGRVGCGCLVFVIVLCMILAAALVHPVSLRFLGNRFCYEDRVMPADVVFVPRIPEDKNGEVYMDAFRQYWEGNGKSIWIEDDRILGFALKDLIPRMAQDKGIKPDTVRAVTLKGDDLEKASHVRQVFSSHGIHKVVLVVPGYASRRFHSIYGRESTGPGGSILFFVKPANVSYFRVENWWKDGESRTLIAREMYRLIALNFDRLIGKKGYTGKQ